VISNYTLVTVGRVQHHQRRATRPAWCSWPRSPAPRFNVKTGGSWGDGHERSVRLRAAQPRRHHQHDGPTCSGARGLPHRSHPPRPGGPAAVAVGRAPARRLGGSRPSASPTCSWRRAGTRRRDDDISIVPMRARVSTPPDPRQRSAARLVLGRRAERAERVPQPRGQHAAAAHGAPGQPSRCAPPASSTSSAPARRPPSSTPPGPTTNDLGNPGPRSPWAGVPDSSRPIELRGDAIFRYSTVGSDTRKPVGGPIEAEGARALSRSSR